MNLTLVALSRSAEKGAALKTLGADFVFDPADPNVRKAVLTAISPKRVDLAVDNIGGALFNELIGMLGYAGRISVVGRSAGAVPEFNTASLFLPPKPDWWRCRERFQPGGRTNRLEGDRPPARRHGKTAGGRPRVFV